MSNYSSFYPANHINYNFHKLIHLANDVKRFGTLDDFSAFLFENNMQNIKNEVHPNNNCLEQLLNRTVEKYNLKPYDEKYFNIGNKQNKSKTKNIILYSVQFNNFKLGVQFKDNVCLLQDNSIAHILKITQNYDHTLLICRRFQSCKSLFSEPSDS